MLLPNNYTKKDLELFFKTLSPKGTTREYYEAMKLILKKDNRKTFDSKALKSYISYHLVDKDISFQKDLIKRIDKSIANNKRVSKFHRLQPTIGLNTNSNNSPSPQTSPKTKKKMQIFTGKLEVTF